MKTIGLLGAIDRYNYGDLLFPIIVEKALKEKNEKLEFNYYGTIESDLSEYGAYKTKSLRSIFLDHNDAIIIVGGATLSSKWTATHLHLIKNKALVLFYRVAYKFTGFEKSNVIARIKVKGKTNFPWILPKSKFKNTKIIYNTVSGTNFSSFTTKEKELLKSDLLDSDYLSVRDPLTERNLRELGVEKTFLYPDSAIIMSKFFPINILKSLINNETKELMTNQKKYLCFQIGKHYAKGQEEVIAEQLIKAAKENNLDVLLLPIGRAAMHEDPIPLLKIKEIIGIRAKVHMPEKNGIYETMLIIANSEIFIGTSLHGNITALSYGVPCIGLDKRVTKLEEFLKQFSVEEQQYSVEYNNIAESIKNSLLIPRKKLINNTDRLISLVEGNFENIYKIIEE